MNTSNETQKYLLSELARYINGKNLSVWLLSELRKWVDSGRSVLDNPWALAGEDGSVLDYLSAKQIIDGEVEEQSASSVFSSEAEDSMQRIVFVGKIKNDRFDSQTLVVATDAEDARDMVLKKYKSSLGGFLHEDDITVFPFVANHEELPV